MRFYFHTREPARRTFPRLTETAARFDLEDANDAGNVGCAAVLEEKAGFLHLQACFFLDFAPHSLLGCLAGVSEPARERKTSSVVAVDDEDQVILAKNSDGGAKIAEDGDARVGCDGSSRNHSKQQPLHFGKEL